MTLHFSVKETSYKLCGTKKRFPSLNYLQTTLAHFRDGPLENLFAQVKIK